MTKTFSIKTLGCKLNQYESSEIAGGFLLNGWEARPFGEMADVVIINTCTVTDRSDKKCRNYIRQGAKFAGAGRVIVTGCMAESEKESLKLMPEVAEVFFNSEKGEIYGKILGIFSDVAGSAPPASVHDAVYQSAPPPLFKTRGYIKIQDGCDNRCSYCIVPSVRGMPRSRDSGEIISHARRLIGDRFYELVLTGITIGKYFHEGLDLAGLLSRLIDLRGDFRVRVTSIEPLHVTERLLELYGSPKICRHIHVPLQSGSSGILGLMNRGYTAADYKSVIERIRSRQADMAIGTDLIIGFPGEDESDFKESIGMLKWSEFAYAHCFKYSKRKGTPASSLRENADYSEINRRILEAKDVSISYEMKYRKQFIGTVFKSVVEQSKKTGICRAVTDNYLKIDIINAGVPGKIFRGVKNVMFTEISGDKNLGVVI